MWADALLSVSNVRTCCDWPSGAAAACCWARSCWRWLVIASAAVAAAAALRHPDGRLGRRRPGDLRLGVAGARAPRLRRRGAPGELPLAQRRPRCGVRGSGPDARAVQLAVRSTVSVAWVPALASWCRDSRSPCSTSVLHRRDRGGARRLTPRRRPPARTTHRHAPLEPSDRHRWNPRSPICATRPAPRRTPASHDMQQLLLEGSSDPIAAMATTSRAAASRVRPPVDRLLSRGGA